MTSEAGNTIPNPNAGTDEIITAGLVQGLSYPEAGRLAGVSAKTVQRHIVVPAAERDRCEGHDRKEHQDRRQASSVQQWQSIGAPQRGAHHEQDQRGSGIGRRLPGEVRVKKQRKGGQAATCHTQNVLPIPGKNSTKLVVYSPFFEAQTRDNSLIRTTSTAGSRVEA